MSPAIGIDLGTVYSCVGVYRNNHVEIIPNSLGGNTLPSVVAFTNRGRLVGNSAKFQMSSNAGNTIYGEKKLECFP